MFDNQDKRLKRKTFIKRLCRYQSDFPEQMISSDRNIAAERRSRVNSGSENLLKEDQN